MTKPESRGDFRVLVVVIVDVVAVEEAVGDFAIVLAAKPTELRGRRWWRWWIVGRGRFSDRGSGVWPRRPLGTSVGGVVAVHHVDVVASEGMRGGKKVFIEPHRHEGYFLPREKRIA
ncbi:hypothetical protein FGIG_12540 [Fasciola gigantica]|uniref:Uncharacterized protein n=1 Tax=Fasciola gigantica TaxID=46835 RepID=A0A504Z2K7_FASGI|nr:hypothetical protein FGIG_12540 [Fasciola gigantica]